MDGHLRRRSVLCALVPEPHGFREADGWVQESARFYPAPCCQDFHGGRITDERTGNGVCRRTLPDGCQPDLPDWPDAAAPVILAPRWQAKSGGPCAMD